MDKRELEKQELLHSRNLRQLDHADGEIDQLRRRITQTVNQQLQEFTRALEQLGTPNASRAVNHLEDSREDFLHQLRRSHDQIDDIRQTEKQEYRRLKGVDK